MITFLGYLTIVSLVLCSIKALHIHHVPRHMHNHKHNPTFNNQHSALKSKVESIVVNSPVLDFAPWLELHHIVLLKDKSNPGIICAIDFSPLDQTNPNTIKNLLLGKSVPAEIRVNWLDGKFNLKRIAEICLIDT